MLSLTPYAKSVPWVKWRFRHFVAQDISLDCFQEKQIEFGTYRSSILSKDKLQSMFWMPICLKQFSSQYAAESWVLQIAVWPQTLPF